MAMKTLQHCYNRHCEGFKQAARVVSIGYSRGLILKNQKKQCNKALSVYLIMNH